MSGKSSLTRAALRKSAGIVAAGSLLMGLAVSAAPPAAAQGDAAEGLRALENQQAATISIVNRIEPAVVHVEAEIPAGARDNQGDQVVPGDPGGQLPLPFGLPFGGPAPRSAPGLATGSGIIIDPSGVIITNRHVVENARNVTVTLTNHRNYKGTVYSDPNVDLAVIKIDADNPLPFVKLADSRTLRIGQSVFAVGYPFNVGETVSRGIISALGRSQVIEGQFYPSLIQTDASINPGNSGGALVDLNGDVIGVNTAIAGAAGQSAGIGFAIPSAAVQAVWPQLANGTHKITNYPKGWIRGKLGVEVQPVTPDLVKVLGTTEGALVKAVTPDSPAALGGIEAGDVIVKLNDSPVRDAGELVDVVSDLGPNQKAVLSIIRNHKPITLTVTTGSMNETRTASTPGNHGNVGLSVQPLESSMRRELQLPNEVHEGVVVQDVQQGSPADDAGLRQGDVIVQVNQTPVHTSDDLMNVLNAAHAGDSVGLRIYRGPQSMFMVIQMPEGQKQ